MEVVGYIIGAFVLYGLGVATGYFFAVSRRLDGEADSAAALAERDADDARTAAGEARAEADSLAALDVEAESLRRIEEIEAEADAAGEAARDTIEQPRPDGLVGGRIPRADE